MNKGLAFCESIILTQGKAGEEELAMQDWSNLEKACFRAKCL